MPDNVTRIFAIRHGETAWNRASRIQGHLDIPLNDKGLWQAQRVGHSLAGEDITAVYSSDLRRAFDTAQALAVACGREVVTVAGLRERHFGDFQGLTFDEIAARWPVDSERWRQRDTQFAPAGGESLKVFFRRCVDTTMRLALRHPGQTIALVAHGGVLDCLYRAASRIELQAPRSWQVGNASINRLLCTGESLSLVGWSDTFHLDEVPLDELRDGSSARDTNPSGAAGSDVRRDTLGRAA